MAYCIYKDFSKVAIVGSDWQLNSLKKDWLYYMVPLMVAGTAANYYLVIRCIWKCIIMKNNSQKM